MMRFFILEVYIDVRCRVVMVPRALVMLVLVVTWWWFVFLFFFDRVNTTSRAGTTPCSEFDLIYFDQLDF
jgi:hypothetical protein